MDEYDALYLSLVAMALIFNVLASVITYLLIPLGYFETNLYRPDPNWNPALSLLWSISLLTIAYGLIYYFTGDHPKAKVFIASLVTSTTAYDFMHDFLLLMDVPPYFQIMGPYLAGVSIPALTGLALLLKRRGETFEELLLS